MLILQETLSTDASRAANASGMIADLNAKIPWDVVGPSLVLLVCVVAVAYLSHDYLSYIWAKLPFAGWRERQRMRAEREKYLRSLLADNVQDAVDAAFLDNLMTGEERVWAFETLGKLGLPELRGVAKTLKEQILEKRRAEEELNKPTIAIVHVM